MIHTKVLFELPETSEHLQSGVSLRHHKGCATIEFNYVLDDDSEIKYSIEIKDVYQFIFTSDSCCTHLHIEGAYEQVILVEGSALVAEAIRNLTVNGIESDGDLHHFKLYVPDFGCCEYIANKISGQSG